MAGDIFFVVVLKAGVAGAAIATVLAQVIAFTVFGQTMATFCGQNIGAGEVARVKKGIKLAIFYTCIWCTMAIIASYTIGPWLVKIYTMPVLRKQGHGI